MNLVCGRYKDNKPENFFAHLQLTGGVPQSRG